MFCPSKSSPLPTDHYPTKMCSISWCESTLVPPIVILTFARQMCAAFSWQPPKPTVRKLIWSKQRRSSLPQTQRWSTADSSPLPMSQEKATDRIFDKQFQFHVVPWQFHKQTKPTQWCRQMLSNILSFATLFYGFWPYRITCAGKRFLFGFEHGLPVHKVRCCSWTSCTQIRCIICHAHTE